MSQETKGINGENRGFNDGNHNHIQKPHLSTHGTLKNIIQSKSEKDEVVQGLIGFLIRRIGTILSMTSSAVSCECL